MSTGATVFGSGVAAVLCATGLRLLGGAWVLAPGCGQKLHGVLLSVSVRCARTMRKSEAGQRVYWILRRRICDVCNARLDTQN